MKNKGFTLIELLAIIVILAIIAVITVPIILDVIEKSQKGAAKDSAYGLTETAKLYYYKLDERNLENYSCNFKSGCDELQYQGETPTSGNIRINDIGLVSGEVTYNKKYTFCIYNNLVYEGTCMEKVGKEFAEEIKQKGETHIYDQDGTIDADKLSNCIAFDITVKTGDTPITFCVIGETENEVTLMSKENIGKETQWSGNTQNLNGPNTAMQYLLDQTKNWDKIQTIENYTYDDTKGKTKIYGYDNLTITNGILTITKKDNTTQTIGDSENKFKARLITYEELINITKGNPFDWMADMWTLSSVENSQSEAYRILSATISYPTKLTGYAVHDSTNIKPVIQISKDNL